MAFQQPPENLTPPWAPAEFPLCTGALALSLPTMLLVTEALRSNIQNGLASDADAQTRPDNHPHVPLPNSRWSRSDTGLLLCDGVVLVPSNGDLRIRAETFGPVFSKLTMITHLHAPTPTVILNFQLELPAAAPPPLHVRTPPLPLPSDICALLQDPAPSPAFHFPCRLAGACP